ncbi:sulfurtransferase TusA [Vibrio sp. SCSIO 43155]|uniref:sulfurtransferase TusA n=1 Tax=Vibrio TaxID=662 RepID=UPI00207593D4|nr:sulfurtransferase TusA [Vibrio sp. SCSIO 43155]USD58678.1 sulfurtransferase TusA [Vibrio sp. SCSIO 43155]
MNDLELLDCVGLNCPEPVMMLRSKIRKMETGMTLLVKADDPSTSRDFPAFCTHMDHELLEQTQDGKVFSFKIKKG